MSVSEPIRDNIILAVILLSDLALFLVIGEGDAFATAGGDPLELVYVLQRALLLLFTFTRRPPRHVDSSPAVLAACAWSMVYPYALLLFPGGVSRSSSSLWLGSILVSFGGLLGLWSIFVLGKSFGLRPASRGVVSNGPYRMVRHPLYTSYFIADVGILWLGSGIGSLAVILSGWLALLLRTWKEEEVLAVDPVWRGYARAVRQKFIPGLL